jgi:hypothetical protein
MWADGYGPHAENLVRLHIGAVLDVQIATPEDDCRRATDFTIVTARGDVAMRVRRWRPHPSPYRDFTVRTSCACGPSELDKLRAPDGPGWYFYGWTERDGSIAEWVLIDLNEMRRQALFDPAAVDGLWQRGRNPDRSTFVALKIAELRDRGCLVVDECRSASPSARGDVHPPLLPNGLVAVPGDPPPPPVKEKDKKPTQGLLFPGFGGPP